MSELSLHQILGQIWRLRWTLIETVFGFGLLAMFILITSTPQYTATMVVAPKPQSLSMEPPEPINARSILTGGSSDSYSPMEVYSSLLSSRAVADAMANDRELMHEVFSDSWDPKQMRWRRPPGVLQFLKDQLRPAFGRPRWSPPSGSQLSNFLSKRILVAPKHSTMFSVSSIQEVSITLPSPDLAVHILASLSRTADQVLRQHMLNEVNSQIAFILPELQQPSTTDTRSTLINLLEQLEQKRVLLGSNSDYAVMVVDPPNSPPTPTFPNPVMEMGSFLVFGFLVAGGLVFVLWRKRAPVLCLPAFWNGDRRWIIWVPAPAWAVGRAAKDVSSRPDRRPSKEAAANAQPRSVNKDLEFHELAVGTRRDT